MSAALDQVDDASLLKVLGLTKAFGATLALDAFDFALAPGQIHALIGENGAGKSTFIKVLAGIHDADSGSITMVRSVDGRPSIAFIHQDLGIVPGMTVAENILLGSAYPRRAGFIDWRRVNALARESLAAVGASFDPDVMGDKLSVSDRALVAIARAIRLKARILVLDEPTAMLPGHDVHKLFDVLKQLRADGIGMIYVSHRLREVLAIADVVTVLRDGRHAFHGSAATLSEADLMAQMVGRTDNGYQDRPTIARKSNKPLISIAEMTTAKLAGATFVVNEGEIVGCVGLRGAGQEAIGRALVGITTFTGHVTMLDRAYKPRDVADALQRGVVFITGNRDMNIVGTMSVLENLFINPRFTPLPRWIRSGRAEWAATKRMTQSYDVRLREPGQSISELSGGNAQKIVLARGLESAPSLVVLEDPTAGVDMPTRFAVYDVMRARAAKGLTFIIISSDHDEVAAICDRIHVFRDGRLTATLDAPPFDPQKIALLAAGATS
jgi:ribose transport system ATP-binding protein